LWRLPLRRRGRAPRPPSPTRWGICALLIYIVLRTAASFDVVGAPQYVFMYLVLGLAWVRVVETTFIVFGLKRARRRGRTPEPGCRRGCDRSVGRATLCYAGANIARRPRLVGGGVFGRRGHDHLAPWRGSRSLSSRLLPTR
jgi:hypothetical protein